MSLNEFYNPSIYAAKAAIVLVFLTIAFRLLGKREVGQFNVYDLVMVIALSNAVQNSMTAGRGELSVGISAALSLLAAAYLLARIYVYLPQARRLTCGVAVILIHQGHVFPDRLRREHVSKEELEAAVRTHGLTSTRDVDLAVLEVDGSISVVPKS